MIDGDLIVEGSRDPEDDVARARLARGVTAKITLYRGQRSFSSLALFVSGATDVQGFGSSRS
jgi:hypothetical protein